MNRQWTSNDLIVHVINEPGPPRSINFPCTFEAIVGTLAGPVHQDDPAAMGIMPVVSSPLDAAVDHATFDSGDESSDGSRMSEGGPDPVGPEGAALSARDVGLNHESEGEESDDEPPLEDEVQATPGTNVLTLHPNDPRAGQ